MKKNAIIISFVLITLSLTAYGLLNGENPEPAETHNLNYEYPVQVISEDKSYPNIFYGIGPRFNGITKTEIDQLETFDDYIGEEHASRIMSYKSMSVILLDDNQRTNERITCQSGNFNSQQKEFMNNLDYSTNFMIWADYVEKNQENGVSEDAYWTPHFTVIPEKQAMYITGEDALLDFVRSKSYEFVISLDQAALKPAKLYITISDEGIITNTQLKASSGFPELDAKMDELIRNLPDNWTPAEDRFGEKIEQTLVFSYGKLGC